MGSLFVAGDLRCVWNFVVTVNANKAGHTGMACVEAGWPRLVWAAVLFAKNLQGIVRMSREDFSLSLRGDQVGCPLFQKPGMHN